jgi:ubiquinone/menaquinone biosynthesis C-methylase UbiE
MLLDAGVDATGMEYRPDLPGPQTGPLRDYPEISIVMTPEPVKLPFETDSFDSALSCGVLEHVGDPDGSLDELHRVLRPGGTLYVYKLPNRFSYLEWIARRLGLRHHGCRPHDRVYRKATALHLLRRHGFEVQEFRRTNILPLTVRTRSFQRHGDGWWRLNRVLARIPLLNLLATNLELITVSDRR